MRIKLETVTSDYQGNVIDIYYDNLEEAFLLGELFNKFADKKLCVWKGKNSIRIPLIDMDEFGLAKEVVPTKKTIEDLKKENILNEVKNIRIFDEIISMISSKKHFSRFELIKMFEDMKHNLQGKENLIDKEDYNERIYNKAMWAERNRCKLAIKYLKDINGEVGWCINRQEAIDAIEGKVK